MAFRAIALWVPLLLAACAALDGRLDSPRATYESTFQRVLEQAHRGDPESQNAAGFMLYRGEGVAADPARAKSWFERAAAAGSDRGRRNLAFLTAGSTPEPRAAAVAASEAPGQVPYQRYCGGCHGLNGIAAYENSPSFSFGERLEKPDAVLMRSLLGGLQEMPAWDGKLPEAELREILAYVRTLPSRYDRGIAAEPAAAPPYIYLFGRMEERRRGAR